MDNRQGTFWIDEQKNELVLKDSNDEQRFFIDEEFNINGEKYIILISTEDDNDEAIAFKLLEDDETLAVIDDDEEFDRVREKYMSM